MTNQYYMVYPVCNCTKSTASSFSHSFFFFFPPSSAQIWLSYFPWLRLHVFKTSLLSWAHSLSLQFSLYVFFLLINSGLSMIFCFESGFS